eukprot:6283888-Ditylum_brightwellii.AAC.1
MDMILSTKYNVWIVLLDLLTNDDYSVMASGSATIVNLFSKNLRLPNGCTSMVTIDAMASNYGWLPAKK